MGSTTGDQMELVDGEQSMTDCGCSDASMTFQPSVEVEAISSDGEPGILRPGESGSVPILVQTRAGSNQLTATVGFADDPDTMNYAPLLQAITAGTTNDAIGSTFKTLTHAAGPTVGDYIQLLARRQTCSMNARASVRADPEQLLSYLISDTITSLDTTLSGTVFALDSSHPLADQEVIADDAKTGVSAVATSDSTGLVRFPNLAAGTYTLSFLNGLAPSNLAPVTVPTQGALTGQNWILQPGGTIAGRVDVPQGVEPADPSTLAVTATDSQGNVFPAEKISHAGYYRITGLPAGTYTVQAAGDDLDTPSSQSVTVAPGQVETLADLVATSGGTITGTVQNGATGQPMAGLFVTVLDDGQNPVGTMTQANGTYTLKGVSPGTHELVVRQSAEVAQTIDNLVVTAGRTTSAGTLEFAPGASLSGTVTLDGQPAADAAVVVTLSSSVSDQVATDSNGNFSFASLQPGTYMLTITPILGAIDTETITLASGQSMTDNVALEPAASVRGTVVEASSGLPLIGATVVLEEPDGATDLTNTQLPDGSYSFSKLPPGQYVVMLPDGSNRHTINVVDASTNATVNFSFSFGSITGHVLEPDGVTGDITALAILLQNGQLIDSASVGPDGEYVFQLVTPGTYDLAFTDSGFTFPIQTGLVVAAGSTTTAAAPAVPGTASLQLAVRDSSNDIVSGQGFLSLQQAALPSGTAAVQTVSIPADGNVSVNDLAPGHTSSRPATTERIQGSN